MKQAEIFDQIRGILANQLSVEPTSVKTESLLSTDLGADSLDMAEIAMEISEKFGREINEKEFSQIKSVGDIVDLLVKEVSGV